MTKQKAVECIGTERLCRSVASSTAIETGEPVRQIEARLAKGVRRFPKLRLAQ